MSKKDDTKDGGNATNLLQPQLRKRLGHRPRRESLPEGKLEGELVDKVGETKDSGDAFLPGSRGTLIPGYQVKKTGEVPPINETQEIQVLRASRRAGAAAELAVTEKVETRSLPALEEQEEVEDGDGIDDDGAVNMDNLPEDDWYNEEEDTPDNGRAGEGENGGKPEINRWLLVALTAAFMMLTLSVCNGLFSGPSDDRGEDVAVAEGVDEGVPEGIARVDEMEVPAMHERVDEIEPVVAKTVEPVQPPATIESETAVANLPVKAKPAPELEPATERPPVVTRQPRKVYIGYSSGKGDSWLESQLE